MFKFTLQGLTLFSDALESETEKKRFDALQTIEGMILNKYKIEQDDYKIIEVRIINHYN